MIYELRGKIPQNSSFIYSEDVLTSTIFGNLRYFSNYEILKEFLSKAKDLENNSFNTYDLSEKIKIHFWTKYSNQNEPQINEPDLLLEDDKNVTIIECKYHSPLDETFSQNHKDYTNQLIRYSTILDQYFSNKDNKNIIFLTLKDYEYKTCLSKTKANISKDIGLYWLCWEELFSILKKAQVTGNGEKDLLNDLISFMKNRRLLYFSGITITNSNYKWKYKLNKIFIFNSKFDLFLWRYLNE